MEQQFEVLELKTPSDYRAEGRTTVFPSAGSLEWFIRKNKAILTSRNALASPTGRTLINPRLFDLVVLEVGSQNCMQGLGNGN
jgi:hypothetical protein